MVDKRIGLRIKELRLARELTQEQVADACGISRQRYARIENGNNNISLAVLSMIAAKLDVSVNDITKVLETEMAPSYRLGDEVGSAKGIFDMLDLFYANKHLYEKTRSQ